MITPFDDVIADIKNRRYHNHRLEEHSDIISKGILRDLVRSCNEIKLDFDSKEIGCWFNVPAPGARHRKIDLLIGESQQDNRYPDLEKLRVCIENKSVVTAHRNRDARFDDLNEALQVLHKVKPEAVLIATVMIGTAEKVLNVPDKIKPMYRGRVREFEEQVLPRLSSGSKLLWKDFSWAVSKNRAQDAKKTFEKFLTLPRRHPSHTHVMGYDFVLLVPVFIDNVNPPSVARSNSLGIDVDKQYNAMLEQICKAYKARWHL